MRLCSLILTIPALALSGCGREPAAGGGAAAAADAKAPAPAGENPSEPLLRDLKNPDESVRLRAVKLAGRLGAGASVAVANALAEAARSDPDADVRRVAGESLEKIHGRPVAAIGAPTEKNDTTTGATKTADPVPAPQPAPPAAEAKRAADDKPKRPAEPSIVGKWTGRIVVGGIPLRLTMTLSADGNYTLTSESGGPVGNTRAGGTYTYEGGVLTSYQTDTNAIERAVITWLNADEFRYVVGGVQVVYRRLP
jgi:hypothetical protein